MVVVLGLLGGVVVAVADWDTDYRDAGNEGLKGRCGSHERPFNGKGRCQEVLHGLRTGVLS